MGKILDIAIIAGIGLAAFFIVRKLPDLEKGVAEFQKDVVSTVEAPFEAAHDLGKQHRKAIDEFFQDVSTQRTVNQLQSKMDACPDEECRNRLRASRPVGGDQAIIVPCDDPNANYRTKSGCCFWVQGDAVDPTKLEEQCVAHESGGKLTEEERRELNVDPRKFSTIKPSERDPLSKLVLSPV